MNLNQFTAQGNTWDPPRALGLNILAHGCWIFSNMLGNIVGNIIVIDTAIVSYTLTAMFIGLWSFHFTSRLLVLTGVFAGVLALVLSGVLDHKLNIVVATILAATVGCVLEGSGVK